MFSAFLQVLLTAGAGGVLYVLWRREIVPARLGFLVTAGFALRAVAGQLLFWISWLELPLLRSLQNGNGLWFFAIDARMYVPLAFEAASDGPLAILMHNRAVASVTYVQVLAAFAMLFGRVVSVGLLLNLFAYLGLSIVVIRWSAAAEQPGNRIALAARGIALAALSLSPSAILWSLQPLKDILFQFLVVAFLGAAVLWQKVWRKPRSAPALLAAAIMTAAIFAIGGIRWYFAFILFAASCVFALLVAMTASCSKRVALGGALLLVVVLAQSLRFGAGPYLPPPVARALAPRTALAEAMSAPSALLDTLQNTRMGFERTGGATAIRAKRKPAPAPSSIVPPGAVAARPDAAPASLPAKRSVITAEKPPGVTPAEPSSITAVKPSLAPPAEPPAPAASPSSTIAAQPAKPPSAVPAPTPVTAAAPAKNPQPPSAQPEPAVPQSTGARLLSGAAAMLIPQSIARRLGLIDVGDGRGLMWFTDLDTLVFDAILLATIVLVIRSGRRAGLGNGALWMIVLTTVVLAVALVYVVTNFGTLFRLRAMVFTGLALIPLTMFCSFRVEPASAAETTNSASV